MNKPIASFAIRELNIFMILKPQDIVVLLKLIALGTNEWTFASLAADLFMSQSEVHAGIKRAIASRLFDESRKRPIRKNLEEFLVHGVKYAYPPQYQLINFSVIR